jgi:chromosome segregation ATPase
VKRLHTEIDNGRHTDHLTQREQEHQIRDVEAEIREAREQAQALKIEGKDKTTTLRGLQAKLGSLDSEEGRLRSQLERIFPDGAKGLAWLEQNKDKFEKEVFGPPMLTCSMKDDQYRDLVQSALQRDDFLCFVAQTANDHRTLSHHLFKELGLSVSIRSSLAPYSEYRNPLPREQLKSFGLDGYATDYIEGPEPVLAMLCGEKRLNATAVGLRDMTDDAYQRIQQVDSLGQFAAGKTSYRVTRRREYGAHATSTRVRTIQPGQFWRDQPVDTAEKTELKQQIDQVTREYEELKTRFKAADKELSETLVAKRQDIVEKVAELRKAKGELQREFSLWQALPDKIGTYETRRAALLLPGSDTDGRCRDATEHACPEARRDLRAQEAEGNLGQESEQSSSPTSKGSTGT